MRKAILESFTARHAALLCSIKAELKEHDDNNCKESTTNVTFDKAVEKEEEEKKEELEPEKDKDIYEKDK